MNPTFTSIDAPWWPAVYILIAGFVANDIWRILGVVFSGRMREDSEIFGFVKAVATALVAGVIAELILFPGGSLARAPLWLRVGAAVIGFAAYRLGSNRILVGVVAGEVVFVIGWWFAVG